MTRYRTLSGRRFDLSQLSSEEQAFVDEVFALYREQPPWERFKSQWVRLGRKRLWKRKVDVGAPAYRICQDLATRLGVAEGKVAPPDYRDLLADLIEARFGSRYAFCKQTGIDQGHLSRVLAGKKHLAPNTLFEVLDSIGVSIDLVDSAELFRRAQAPFLAGTTADRLRSLEVRVSALRDLAARLEQATTPEQRRALASQPSAFAEADPLATFRPLLATGEDVAAVVDATLDAAYREQAELGKQITAEAEAQRGVAG